MIVQDVKNGSLSDDELAAMYDGPESSAGHAREPPPSYEASSTASTSLSDMDVKTRSLSSDTSLGKSPVQLPMDDLIAGSSSRPARRSLPPKPVSAAREEQEPMPSQAPPQQQQQSPSEPPQQPEISAVLPPRPQLPHAAHSAPDPRARAKMDRIQERDMFGSIDDEGPFAAGRRAQRVDNEPKHEADPRVYVNGHMPSFKPGEILPVNTMRPATSAPPFFPPHEAPSFPPISPPPIRPAHFPPNLHPNPPPSGMPVSGQPSPTHAQPVCSQTMRHPVPTPPPQPQPQHQPRPEPLRAMSHQQPSPPQPPQAMRSYSHGHPTPSPPPPQPPNPSAPPQLRRHTYDPRSGIPPGLAPGGRYVGHPGVPQPQSAPHPSQQPQPVSHLQHLPPPHGYPQPQPQPYPPSHPQGAASQAHPVYHSPQPGRSILRQPMRHSVQAPSPSHSPLAPPAPTPVRLPSQNVPPSPHALGIVHAPPTPSDSPRPDSNRAPRSTPKPVMPQLLEPLAQANNYGRGGATQLQRSTSSLPSEKGGLLSKTRSILRKRGSTSGIKTHADGAITFASQQHPSKRYENHPPTLTSVKEESGGAMGKLSKRLSKKR